MSLITLEQAKAHLNTTHDEDDEKIGRQMEEASDIVLDYLKLSEDEWQETDGTPIETGDDRVPRRVRAATLLVLGALYDNADGQNPDKQPLSLAVKALLYRLRDPALA